MLDRTPTGFSKAHGDSQIGTLWKPEHHHHPITHHLCNLARLAKLVAGTEPHANADVIPIFGNAGIVLPIEAPALIAGIQPRFCHQPGEVVEEDGLTHAPPP